GLLCYTAKGVAFNVRKPGVDVVHVSSLEYGEKLPKGSVNDSPLRERTVYPVQRGKKD
ncbi:hypothetical protein A2U01_0072396, partial [Trifolium medium]|nr:hypothetical protein [Trifolium medium]